MSSSIAHDPTPHGDPNRNTKSTTSKGFTHTSTYPSQNFTPAHTHSIPSPTHAHSPPPTTPTSTRALRGGEVVNGHDPSTASRCREDIAHSSSIRPPHAAPMAHATPAPHPHFHQAAAVAPGSPAPAPPPPYLAHAAHHSPPSHAQTHQSASTHPHSSLSNTPSPTPPTTTPPRPVFVATEVWGEERTKRTNGVNEKNEQNEHPTTQNAHHHHLPSPSTRITDPRFSAPIPSSRTEGTMRGIDASSQTLSMVRSGGLIAPIRERRERERVGEGEVKKEGAQKNGDRRQRKRNARVRNANETKGETKDPGQIEERMVGPRSTKRSNQTIKTKGKVEEITPPERPSSTDRAFPSRYNEMKNSRTWRKLDDVRAAGVRVRGRGRGVRVRRCGRGGRGGGGDEELEELDRRAPSRCISAEQIRSCAMGGCDTRCGYTLGVPREPDATKLARDELAHDGVAAVADDIGRLVRFPDISHHGRNPTHVIRSSQACDTAHLALTPRYEVLQFRNS
ncbi:hypothetical protein DFP72DRAFT_862802 [Ephemerocybe angulata]|uniref:Uncharacterized protein n=1 Tax=Ephemerocybe angulata TaxID=980116 RepID=A0A8H6H6C5_9AGAR|nr:hypothetical protein DFP72DRAFT_862802 [Tulosesus angulatus]